MEGRDHQKVPLLAQGCRAQAGGFATFRPGEAPVGRGGTLLVAHASHCRNGAVRANRVRLFLFEGTHGLEERNFPLARNPMLQIIQSYRTGEMELAEVPVPVCDDNGVLVRTAVSLVSAGTEKMLVDLAKKSLAGKALARPDLVKQVVNKMKKEGVKQTLEKVFTKLDNPIPLGYS